MTEYFPVINNGRTLRGTLHVGCNEVPILIVHGYFSANKIGAHRLYVQMANMLAKLGFSVLRIDLSGMGESDGEISDFEFEDHVSDVSMVASKLMEYADSSKIHYIGHCVGTCTVFQSAMRNAKHIASLTLISPFMPSEENYIKLLMSKTNYNELQTVGLTIRKGLVCKKSFIDAGYVIVNYPKFYSQNKSDSTLYFSENDEMVSLEGCVTWAEKNDLSYKIVAGADHNFINPTAREKLFYELENRFRTFNIGH